MSSLNLLKNLQLHKGPKGFQILAQGRPLKINNKEINIPSKRFAESLMVEWRMLKELKPSKLPLSQLYSRSVDFKDVDEKRKCSDQLLKFFNNDSLCFLGEFPSNLKELQETHCKPLLKDLRSKFDLKLPTTKTLSLNPHSEDVKAIANLLERTNNIELAALERSAITAKSLLIGVALCNGMISSKQATILARLETVAQIEWFGEVEDSHDIDEEYVIRELNGVKLFLNSFTVKSFQ